LAGESVGAHLGAAQSLQRQAGLVWKNQRQLENWSMRKGIFDKLFFFQNHF
jgi:hypothetical protein